MVHRLPSVDELRARLARGAAAHAALEARIAARVVRWVWATGPLRALSPAFDHELHGWPRGEELAAAPSPRTNQHQVGLDTDGRQVIVRVHQDDDGHFTRQVFDHRDGVVETWAFGSEAAPATPSAVGTYLLDGPRVVGYASLHAQGESFVETYEYEGGALKVLRRTGSNPAIGGIYVHDYDPAGRIATITMESTSTGRRGVVYQRPTRSLAALLKAIKARLPALIQARVAACPLAGPAFALALVYDPGSTQSMLPPKLALGLESERTAWRASGAAREALWDAQGFATFDADALELDDAALLADTLELAPLLTTEAAMVKAHKVLVDVARALNALDWKTITRVTPDFVVYPVDLHLEHLDRDMAAAVPAARRKRLVADPSR